MPRRYGTLWASICDIENIKAATLKVLDRRRKKGHWGQQEQNIHNDLENFCKQVQRSLINRTYEFGKVYHRKIKEGRKERAIDHLDVAHAVLLQCALNICQPLFIEKYIKGTYSSIPDRGITQMSIHIRRAIRKHPEYHFILIDESKCYQNVDHIVMMDILRATFKDVYLLEFFERLIAMLPEGLAIGFSTNHYFVNLLFSRLDHRLAKMKGVRIFRYMDDILILCPKEMMVTVYKIVQEEIDAIHQIIKPTTRFAPIDYGIDFCGYVYYSDCIKLRSTIKQNIIKRDKHLRKIKASDEEYKQMMAAYWGWIKYSDELSFWLWVLKDKAYLFQKQINEMKRFSDIAEGKDKQEQYEGEYWRKGDILDKEVEFLKFRPVKVHGKDKYIIQARINDTYGYFFTEAIGVTDKLERYKEELPFIGTLKELTNNRGQKYMTII